MNDEDRCHFPTWRSDDPEWAERLRSAVEKTLTARAARRDERANFNQARQYGVVARHAVKEAHSRNQSGAGTPDRVSKPCHQATDPQVTATPPDAHTGENGNQGSDQ